MWACTTQNIRVKKAKVSGARARIALGNSCSQGGGGGGILALSGFGNGTHSEGMSISKLVDRPQCIGRTGILEHVKFKEKAKFKSCKTW